MQQTHPSLLASIRGPIWFAVALAVGFLLGFGSWAAIAPLTSAAVAPGFVGVETRRQTVQHLDGGLIAEINVAEGDSIAAGDLLLRLDDTIAGSTYDLLEGQFIDLLAERSRLRAEQSAAVELDNPEELAAMDNKARVDTAMRAQRDLFNSRRDTLRNRTEILDQRILKLKEQINGFSVQEASARRRLQIIGREQAAVERMVRQGLEREPRLLALQRTAAEIEGFLGDIISRHSQAQVRIGETRLEIIDLKAKTVNQVTGDLRDLAGRIADMEPRLRAARNTLERVEITAPTDGTVVALQHHTIGGVVRPGGRILDIVPSAAEFLIEAQVSPADIDVVRPGLPAEVRLTAFAARTTPTVAGTVVHVSADRFADQATQQHYYAVHVRLDPDPDLLAEFGLDLSALYPGMPVEVLVVTGKRTALDYLIQPITDSFARAFREN